jgi:hypothetical protein
LFLLYFTVFDCLSSSSLLFSCLVVPCLVLFFCFVFPCCLLFHLFLVLMFLILSRSLFFYLVTSDHIFPPNVPKTMQGLVFLGSCLFLYLGLALSYCALHCLLLLCLALSGLLLMTSLPSHILRFVFSSRRFFRAFAFAFVPISVLSFCSHYLLTFSFLNIALP